MGKLQVLANSFRNFRDTLFGNSSTSNATSTITDINDGLTDIGTSAVNSAGDVSKASKQIKRSLSSIDELNIINNSSDSSSGGSSSVGSVGGGFSSANIPQFEGQELGTSKLAEKIKELIKPLNEINFDNLVKALNNLKEALKPITKKLAEGLEWLWTTILVPLAKWAIEDFLPAFLDAVAGALKTLNGILGFTKPLLQWLWEDLLIPLGKWTGGVIVSALKKIGTALSTIGDWLDKHAPTLKQVKEEMKPFTKLFQEIGKAIKTILDFAWDSFTKVLQALWNNALKPIWDYFLKPLLTGLWESFKGIATIISGIVEALNNLMAGDWQGIGESIVNGLTEGIKTIWDGTLVKKYLYDPIVNKFKEWFGIKSPSTVFTELGVYLVQGLSNGLSAIWDAVKDIFENLKTQITNVFNNIWSNIKNIFSLNNVKTYFNSVLTTIKNVFSSIPNWFSTKFTEAWTKVKNVFSTGGKIFSGIKEGIEKVFKTVVNKIFSGIEKVIAYPFNKINSMLNSIRNVSILGVTPFDGLWGPNPISVPKLPRLAQGGYVPANNPRLAIIGDNTREGEIVAPESKIYDQVIKAIKDSNNNTKEIEIKLMIMYEDGKKIIKRINQAQIDAGEILLLT